MDKCGLFLIKIDNFIVWTLVVSQCLIGFPQKTYAQSFLSLPPPGNMVTPTSDFNPPVMKGVKIYSNNPLRFDFIVDTGDAEIESISKAQFSKLIKYFLAALTVPEDEQWVNLSPYEKNRIIPDQFSVTEMGRDLLAQDYLLKQLTASMIYPEDQLGEKFWEKVHKKANDLYKVSEIPLKTFNKVWVIPDKAMVYESGDIAFVSESHLKVMLEGDYLALKESIDNSIEGFPGMENTKGVSDISSQIIREVILPEIEKEVNNGENFALLRQIYSSMILATWFKRNLKESILGKVYVQKNKVTGIDIEDKNIKEKIYQQYLNAFKVGVYDYVKEDYDPITQEIVSRKYFSGGMEFQGKVVDKILSVESKTADELLDEAEKKTDGALNTVSTYLETVRNLEKEIRLIRRAAKKNPDIFGEITTSTSMGEIMDALLIWLENNDLITSKQNRDGSELIIISDKAKEFELGRLLFEGGLNNMGVIKGAAGIKMNNYKRPNGEYRIIGFESESTEEQIQQELLEVQKRREGKHQLEAFVLSAQESGGQKVADYESFKKDAQKWESARQDEIGASTVVAENTEEMVMLKQIVSLSLGVEPDHPDVELKVLDILKNEKSLSYSADFNSNNIVPFVRKGETTSIEDIVLSIEDNGKSVMISGINIKIDQDLLNEYQAFGFISEEEFLANLTSILFNNIHQYRPTQDRLFIGLLDESNSHQTDEFTQGFVGINRHFIEQLKESPKTALALLIHGLQRRIIHDSHYIEKNVLIDHYESQGLSFYDAVMAAQDFINEHLDNLPIAIESEGLFSEVVMQNLQEDLRNAESLGLDMKKLIFQGVLRHDDPFASRYVREKRSKYRNFIVNTMEVSQLQFGFVEEKDPIYVEINQIFTKVRKAAGWDEGSKLHILNSDDINAYWLTDSGDFVLSLGLIKSLKDYLESNGKTLTQDHLAWVLGHERRHFWQYAQGKDKAPKEASGNVLTMKKNLEFDADIGGVFYAAFAGYNPKASVDVLNFLDQLGDIPFMGTHPKSDNRIGEVQKIIPSPDIALPNVGKGYQDLSDKFLNSSLLNTPASATVFHQKMLEAKNLDELMVALDDIDDPVQLEEFLMHYYFRMLYNLSSGVMKSEHFREYMSFVITAYNISLFTEQQKYRNSSNNMSRTKFERDWEIPVSIGLLFQYYFLQGGGEEISAVDALGEDFGMKKSEIKKSLRNEIQSEIDRLKSGGTSSGNKETTIASLEAILKSLDEAFKESLESDLSRVHKLKDKGLVITSDTFDSLDEAYKEVGQSFITDIFEQPSGKFRVSYLDREALLNNMESFWSMFEDEYDQSTVELREQRYQQLNQIEALGLKDWLKKRYGRLKQERLLADIRSNMWRKVKPGSPRARSIEDGRTEFFAMYMRALAFHFLNSKVGAFGVSTNKDFSTDPYHRTQLNTKLIQITQKQFSQSGLSSEGIELLSLIRYMSVFRGLMDNVDQEINDLMNEIPQDQLNIIADIIANDPPVYKTNMPQNIQSMLDLSEEYSLFQKNSTDYLYNVLREVINQKIKRNQNIDLQDLDRAMALKRKLKGRGESQKDSHQFNELIMTMVSQILITPSSEIVDLLLTEVNRYNDEDLKRIVLSYLLDGYYLPNNLNGKIEALLRVFPDSSEARNKYVERIFESSDYQMMMFDFEKEFFLEKILYLFKTEKNDLFIISEKHKNLHQKLSQEYMKLLIERGLTLFQVIQKMDSVGAVVTQFDLIVDNQDYWKYISLEEMQNIMGVIKNSKNGYQHYHFQLGTIAISKSVLSATTFMMTDTTSESYRTTDERGYTISIGFYKEAMNDDSDFKTYFRHAIKGNDSIFQNLSLDEILDLILEYLPKSEERSEIIQELIPEELTVSQALKLMDEFEAFEDHGELTTLIDRHPAVGKGLAFVYLGLSNQIDKNEYDLKAILEALEQKFDDAKSIDFIEANRDLSKLKELLREHIEKYEIAVAAKYGNVFNSRLGYAESIEKEIYKFFVKHLIRGNPHFDYLNLRDFKYEYGNDRGRFVLIWPAYSSERSFLKSEALSVAEKIKKIIQFFPEKTSIRNNEFEQLIAIEEGRILGVPPILIEQHVNLIGYEIYEVAKQQALDTKGLDVNKAQMLIDLYKQLIPLMTDGTHQIVLGRKVFALEKKFFPEKFRDFDVGLQEILEIFPNFSLARDSVLNEFINMGSVRIFAQLLKVNTYILEQQRLTQEKDIVNDTMLDDLWNTINKIPSRKEKADFILWLLDPENRSMPSSLEKMAAHNNVNFDSLPSIIFALTKGERDKFFYDFLRGYNGLFEVNAFSDEEVQAIINKVLSQRVNTVDDVLSKNSKADRGLINSAFDQLELDQNLESLAQLFAVIEKQGGSKIKETAKKIVGAAMFDPLLEKIAAIDINTIIDNKDALMEAIQDLENIQNNLDGLTQLLALGSKIGLGKNLNKNVQRIKEVAKDVSDLQSLVSDITQVLETFNDIQLDDVERFLSQVSEIKEHLETLRNVQSQVEMQSDRISRVYNDMRTIASDIGAMRSEIDTFLKLTNLLEKVGLFSGTSERFQQLDRLLSLSEDAQIKSVIQQIQNLVRESFNESQLSSLEYIQSLDVDIQNNQQFDSFISELFYNVFGDGELGNAEDLLKDIFETVFMSYSTERRILLFNALLDIFADEEMKSQSRAKKVRVILEQMGVIGVKVAQYLSEQPQLFVEAEDILIELRNLKKDATFFHNRVLFQLVQEEDLSDVIVEIQDRMAAASVKQVNKVLLSNGVIAAGKFLRPSAEKWLKEDLFVTDKVLMMLSQKYPDIGLPVDMRDDLEKMVLEEVDFSIEAENVRQYRENLAARETTERNGFKFKVPEIYHHTSSVIIEELVNGITFDDLLLVKIEDNLLTAKELEKKEKIQARLEKDFTLEERQKLLAFDIQTIKDAVIREFFESTFAEGFYHADLHYGNVMLTPSGELYLIDFGSSGHSDEGRRQDLLKLLVSISSQNTGWTSAILDQFLNISFAASSKARRELDQEITSTVAIEIKLKNIIKIIKAHQLGANEELMVYLKGLSAVSPMFDSLSNSKKSKLVASYLTRKSKLAIAARKVESAVKWAFTEDLIKLGRNNNGRVTGSDVKNKKEGVGGIDLNPELLNLQTQGAGVNFNISIDNNALQSIEIDGLSPVIFKIIPTNLPLLIGMVEGR